MDFKLRKAPNRNLYWIVDGSGKKYPKHPIPKHIAHAHIQSYYHGGTKIKIPPHAKVKHIELSNELQKIADLMGKSKTSTELQGLYKRHTTILAQQQKHANENAYDNPLILINANNSKEFYNDRLKYLVNSEKALKELTKKNIEFIKLIDDLWNSSNKAILQTKYEKAKQFLEDMNIYANNNNNIVLIEYDKGLNELEEVYNEKYESLTNDMIERSKILASNTREKKAEKSSIPTLSRYVPLPDEPELSNKEYDEVMFGTNEAPVQEPPKNISNKNYEEVIYGSNRYHHRLYRSGGYSYTPLPPHRPRHRK